MKILVCEPEKPPYVKEISEDVSDMQAVVGGYIEAVYFEEKGDALIFCNDEFLLNGRRRTAAGEMLSYVPPAQAATGNLQVNFMMTLERACRPLRHSRIGRQIVSGDSPPPQEVLAILFGMEEESQDFGMM